jgi:hypothetical protein
MWFEDCISWLECFGVFIKWFSNHILPIGLGLSSLNQTDTPAEMVTRTEPLSRGRIFLYIILSWSKISVFQDLKRIVIIFSTDPREDPSYKFYTWWLINANWMRQPSSRFSNNLRSTKKWDSLYNMTRKSGTWRNSERRTGRICCIGRGGDGTRFFCSNNVSSTQWDPLYNMTRKSGTWRNWETVREELGGSVV